MKKLFLIIFLFLLIFNARPVFADNFFPDNFNQLMEFFSDQSGTKLNSSQDIMDFNRFDEDYPFKVEKKIEPVKKEELNQVEKQKDKSEKKKVSFWDVINLKTIFSPSTIFSHISPFNFMLSSFFTTYLLDADQNLYQGLQRQLSDPELKKFSSSFTYLGEGAVDLAGFGLLSLFGNKRDKEVAQMGIEAVALTGCQLQLFLKRVLGISRPDWYPHIGPTFKDDAMPSGHTAVVFATATVLGEAYNIKWITYPLAFLVGISRIEQTAHWPSDVFVGGLMGHLAAKQVMAAHGFIDDPAPWTECRWGDSLFRMQGGTEVNTDSNPLYLKNPTESENYGRIFMKGNLSTRLSKDTIWDVSYYYERVVYDIHLLKNAENKYFLTGMTQRINDKNYVGLYLNYRAIEFMEVNNNPNRLNYVDYAPVRDYGVKYINKLNDNLALKFDVKYSTTIYSHYNQMDSNGMVWGVSLDTLKPFKDRLSCMTGYESGAYVSNNSFYNLQKNKFYINVNYKIASRVNISPFYEASSYNYNYFDNLGYSPNLTINDIGVKLKYDFDENWWIECGYLTRNASSNYNTWDYGKDLLSISVTKAF